VLARRGASPGKKNDFYLACPAGPRSLPLQAMLNAILRAHTSIKLLAISGAWQRWALKERIRERKSYSVNTQYSIPSQ
jgi:hypothetical protein